VILLAILFCGLLTMWIETRWAWTVCQIALFVLAAWRVVNTSGCRRPREWQAGRPALRALALAAAALWPLVQLAAGTTMARIPTEDAALNWFGFFIVFLLADELPLRPIAIGGAAFAAVSLVAMFTAQGRIFWLFPSGYSADVIGPFVNRNQFAAWVELLLPIALYLAATQRRHRMTYAVAAAILFASVIAAASRAGAVLVCLEVAAVAALTSRRLALLFAPVAVLAVAVAGWQNLSSRILTSGPEILRADALHASLEMVRDHPLTGTGLGAWSRIYPRYAGVDLGLAMHHAHNDWAQWAAEGGLPFLACLLTFAALSWKPAIRSIYGLGVIAFLLHALVDFPMQQRPALAAWFFAVAGMTTNDLLRRAGNPRERFSRRDPARLSPSGETCTSGSVRR
jgi:O-antigen ligase